MLAFSFLWFHLVFQYLVLRWEAVREGDLGAAGLFELYVSAFRSLHLILSQLWMLEMFVYGRAPTSYFACCDCSSDHEEFLFHCGRLRAVASVLEVEDHFVSMANEPTAQHTVYGQSRGGCPGAKAPVSMLHLFYSIH